MGLAGKAHFITFYSSFSLTISVEAFCRVQLNIKATWIVSYLKEIQASRYECAIKNVLSYFSTKTYVVSALKNRLNETVLLGTHNICLNWCIRIQ